MGIEFKINQATFIHLVMEKDNLKEVYICLIPLGKLSVIILVSI